MAHLRRIFTWLLTLVLVATSGTAAAMRDHEAGAQRIVICTGHGPQLILLGAGGEEITPAPICPDCTMVLAALPVAPSAPPRQMGFSVAAPLGVAARSEICAPADQNQARAPPVPV
ncbi:hypothetical protein C8N43_1380 [Litoreibacter ponti]|uniref:DUF2946 family protein n=1 Tax=Litoreibacter ponti TaxID=1510457 RepID=A0A2T6BKX2_9RHOB|nr:hypothetical protein [Litoreibacter ponti]PTX56718.1 hypothetical protein C8N43_1380 [Litoreibacter ponti]